jgi:hypothetical protein
MAINKNHEFEELNGVKCGIVERNVKPERMQFLKELLEFNGLTVVAVPSPPPKTAAPAAPKPTATTAQATQSTLTNEVQPAPAPTNEQVTTGTVPPAPAVELQTTPAPPETFTVGVTDYTFNPINAIFGRQLKTRDGHIVTLAYWRQEENVSDDEKPYYET